MLIPADARPWLITLFSKNMLFLTLVRKLAKFIFQLHAKGQIRTVMSASDLPNWNFEKMHHGKRESYCATMVLDCIDPPWLRALEGPLPTFVSHRESWGRHRIRVKICIGTMLCLEKRYTYTCMHLYPICFPAYRT